MLLGFSFSSTDKSSILLQNSWENKSYCPSAFYCETSSFSTFDFTTTTLKLYYLSKISPDYNHSTQERQQQQAKVERVISGICEWTWTGSTSARFVLYTRGRGILIGHRGRGDWGKEVEAEIVPPPCLLEIEKPCRITMCTMGYCRKIKILT